MEGSGVEPSQEQQAIDQIKKVMEIAEEQKRAVEEKKKIVDEEKKEEEVKPVAPTTQNDTKAIMEDMKKDQLLPDGGAAAVVADNGATTEAPIKEENVEKCNKCLKPGYKFRHDGFCGKCSAQGVIDPAEAEDLTEAINCKKCLKPKYLARNEDLCQNTCTAEIAAAKKNGTAAVTAGEQSKPFKFGTTDMNAGSDNNKNDAAPVVDTAEEEDEEAVEEEKETEAATPSGAETQATEEENLGPLGNLIKYLVVQNTFL